MDAESARAGARSQDWEVLGLIRWSAQYLVDKGVERGRLDAELLLADVLGLGRLQLYLQFDRPLTAQELDRFRPLLLRRARREPLQYILGHQAFRDLVLEVNGAVLIPRPETEALVGEVLEWAKGRTEGLAALDVGTGSGAIALSLALEGPFASVIGSDVSQEALAVATGNREKVGLRDRVELRLGSFFGPLSAGERFDVIVSNPPYVAEVEREGLEPEVSDWEPARALFAGLDGLESLRALAAGAGRHLRRGGLVALEVGAGQAVTVVGLLEETGEYDRVTVRRDLTGRERFVLAQRAGD